MNSKLTFILTCLISLNSFAQVSVGNTSLSEREVIGNLNIPWEIKWGHDDYIWMTERPGIVSRVDVETGSKQVLLDIQSLVFSDDWSEAGLLGMEFHPDFETNHILFLTYTFIEASSVKERLVAYTYNEGAQTLENEQILIDNINGYTTHTGSRIHNLDDYTILMSTGDAQDQSASQDVNALTGKFLRIDISEDNFGGVPADNPIPGSYIWSWGHRNAQGLELAPNGIIYSSEHGPTTDDELNILEPNRNFGWPDVQGFCNLPTETGFCAQNNVVEPLTAWTPTIAPSDIIWYDHPAIPEFQNTLLMTVLKNKMLVRFEFSEDGRTVTNQTDFFNNYWGRLRDICVSPNGKIYLATNGTSWPSQPPNEIIELSNTDYYNNLISGCTDSTATNYSNLANLDDGSCEWLDCENNLSNTSFTALVEDSVCHSNLYCEEWGWDGGDCVFDCNNDLMTIWDIDGYFYNGQCDQILNCMAYNFDNESCLEPQGCEDENGVSYDHGVQWSTDPCTLCSCDNGVIACATEACENLICDAPNYLENVQGQCCPVCIEVQPETDCTVQNIPVELNVGWGMFGYTCLEPQNVIDAFSSITADIIIIKDYIGDAYLPEWAFNGIGTLEFARGYQIKMLQTVEGFQFCPTPSLTQVSGQDQIDQLQIQLDQALDNISSLEQEMASIIPEDGVSQSDLDALAENYAGYTAPLNLQIGDQHAGGIVFQINENGSGLVAAMEDLPDLYDWGQSITQASSFSSNGYSGWHLPSIDELYQIYLTIGQGADNPGNFKSDWYWTSSEWNYSHKWYVDFSNGESLGGYKDNTGRVRVIRAF